jgi:hypothetical protein
MRFCSLIGIYSDYKEFLSSKLVTEAIDFWRSKRWPTVAKPSAGGRRPDFEKEKTTRWMVFYEK